MNESIGAEGTFWLYGGICLSGFLFIRQNLPETKGKTLEEIEKELINVIGNVDIWNLSGEEFELITKVRELKSAIAQIKAQCK